MYIGADYYPEHWDRRRWRKDAELMQKAGFNVVRMAEFAWVFLEPEEGRFEFDWLDEAIGVLHARGISTILGTPTAVMPAWLARHYPETLSVDAKGHRVEWGVRKNNCFSSGAYRLLSERITRAMAGHFHDNPAVIGWQTDNEFGGPECFCDSCRAEWHAWLRRRYGAIDALNKAWGTHFWGHVFREWDEIALPVDPASHNPSACLDWKRFHSWIQVRFQHDQVAILREVCPKHFITHNFMGLYSGLDYYDLARDLDFVSWDNYPVWGAPPAQLDMSAFAADVMRGLKRKNFWIMEQTAGPGGWSHFGRNPRPGEIRSVAYQQLARGADGQVWFRWRTCTAGREQYWHGLLQHDGRPLRRYKEAAQVASEYRRLAPELAGTTVKAEVAMVYDYETIWATDIQPGYEGHSYQEAARRFYAALHRLGVNVDIIPPSADFSAYKFVLAPDLYLLPDALAKRLDAYVKAGGVLLADCRLGVKDETSLCHERTLPGLLSDVLGIAIEEYSTIPEAEGTPVAGGKDFPGRFTAERYADYVKPRAASALASFEAWYLKCFAALTRNAYGKGVAWYVGTVVREPEFYDRLMAEAIASAGVKPLLPATAPLGVEVSCREGGGRKLLFVVNHTQEPVEVAVPAGKTDLLSGGKTGETLALDRYGVAVLKMK
ncbi:MAG: beta-galactosidase [Kiritimatiellia bacterium]|jgi:beta-galactosidase